LTFWGRVWKPGPASHETCQDELITKALINARKGTGRGDSYAGLNKEEKAEFLGNRRVKKGGGSGDSRAGSTSFVGAKQSSRSRGERKHTVAQKGCGEPQR